MTPTTEKNPECKKCGLLKSTVDSTFTKCVRYGDHDFPSPSKPSRWRERFQEMKMGFIAYAKDEWWSSDEDYILDFIQSAIDEAYKEGKGDGFEEGLGLADPDEIEKKAVAKRDAEILAECERIGNLPYTGARKELVYLDGFAISKYVTLSSIADFIRRKK